MEYEADSYGIPQYQPLKQEYQESAPYQVKKIIFFKIFFTFLVGTHLTLNIDILKLCAVVVLKNDA